MSAQSGNKLHFRWQHLGLIIAPTVIFFAVNWMMTRWGLASLDLAQPFVRDGHAEAAGRLRTLATFLIVSALAIGAIVYCVRTIWRLDRTSLLTLGIAYFVTIAVGTTIAISMGLHKGDPYFERNLACTALGRLNEAPKLIVRENPPGSLRTGAGNFNARMDQPVPESASKEKGSTEKMPPPARVTSEELALQCSPPNSVEDGLLGWKSSIRDSIGPSNHYPLLHVLISISALLLFFAMPAVMWGAIACLALPKQGSPKELFDAWEMQTERLNRILYLTAAFMVAGLIFTSVRLSWPAYGLHPQDLKALSAHVSSLVFYQGVTNSILIASYYLPVAALLMSARPPKPEVDKPRTGKKSDDRPVTDPFGAMKTAATILAPAAVGFINELLKLNG